MSVIKDKLQHLKIRPGLLFLFCFFMYSPLLKAMPSLVPALVYGVSIIYVLLNWKLIAKACRTQRKTVLFVVLLLLLSLLVPIFTATNDYSYLSVTTYFFRRIIIYLFLLCLIIKKHGEKEALHYFLYYFAVTHLIYVISTLILVLIPSIQNAWFSIFKKEAAEVYMRTDNYTFRLGWKGFAGFRVTLCCTFGVIFLLYLRYGNKSGVINSKQFWIPFIGCIAGNMFYGRSGLILSIVVSVIAVIVWNRKHLGRVIRFACLIIGVILVVMSLKNIPAFNTWYNWMSRPIVNMLSSGEFNDSSFDKLREMNQVEISFDTFLTGDGLYTENGHYYKWTDAGFVRGILFWGIFGALLSYGITLYGIFETRKISKLMAIQFLIVFLSFEYKGVIYYEFITLTSALYVAYIISKRGNSRLDEKAEKELIEAEVTENTVKESKGNKNAG